MKLSKKHWYRRFLGWTKGMFRENPVLVLGLAIPFAAVASTSLQTAVAIALGALVTMLPTVMLASFIDDKIPEWLDLPVYTGIACLFLMPMRMIIARISVTALDSIGVYFSLLCVSTLMMVQVGYAQHEKRNKIAVFLRTLRQWLGFSFVVLLLGLIREIIGNGTIWGHALPWMKIRFSGVMVAGAGFILLGFLGAIGKKLHRLILEAHRIHDRRLRRLKEETAANPPKKQHSYMVSSLMKGIHKKAPAKDEEKAAPKQEPQIPQMNEKPVESSAPETLDKPFEMPVMGEKEAEKTPEPAETVEKPVEKAPALSEEPKPARKRGKKKKNKAQHQNDGKAGKQ